MASTTADESTESAGAEAETKPAAKAAPKKATGTRKPKDRIERYSVLDPKGETVMIERNIDTGESKRV